MVPAFGIMAVSVTFVSLFTSVLSIKLWGMAAGVLAVLVAGFGVFHGVLDIFKSMLGGACLSFLLAIVPDLNGIQKAAYRMAIEKSVETHVVWLGLLALWIVSLGLVVFKRKEA